MFIIPPVLFHLPHNSLTRSTDDIWRNGVFYPIETPTREMYTRSGNTALGARIDVTVYGSRWYYDDII